MIVDSSALVAVLLGEDVGDEVLEVMLGARSLSMSTATYVECAVVVDRRTGPASRDRFDRLVAQLGIRLVDLTVDQASRAREAYARYGKGSGHPAGLNLGDCFSYALSSVTGEPLLFVGDDFSHTDLTPARTP